MKEEEYHWLLHEDIAVIAYAMTDSKNRTLRRSGEVTGDEVSKSSPNLEVLPREMIDRGKLPESIVSHNLHPGRNLNDPFHPLQKMVIVLPDGDNGFYTDENEGRRLFPETKNQKACDDFYPGEAMNYSLVPFLYMKPGAVGKHESYFLELLQHLESQSQYKERLLRRRGLGGVSMGGFGAMKLGLKTLLIFSSR